MGVVVGAAGKGLVMPYGLPLAAAMWLQSAHERGIKGQAIADMLGVPVGIIYDWGLQRPDRGQWDYLAGFSHSG